MLFVSVILARILVALLSVAQVQPTEKNDGPNESKSKIRFNKSSKLKIVTFADLHYGEFPGTIEGNAQDGNTTRVMTDILNMERPDFVVLAGDLVTGDDITINPTGYVDQLLKPLVAGNYRWASIYGNHDNGKVLTREDIFKTESKYNLSYTQHGGKGLAGLTNYYLPVYAAQGESNQNPVLILWFFDSRGGFDPSGPIPFHIDESVMEWFKHTNQNITNRWGKLPALAYFHIPVVEYKEVQQTKENHLPCVGPDEEPVSPQPKNTGLMEALVNAGTVMTTFVGHNHGNAWCCTYKGVEICTIRHTGYGGYGNWTRGARVIELEYPNVLEGRKNYIRLENGTVINSFPV